MRLDRFLSEQTAYSRRELAAMIRRGCVTANGAVMRKPETQVQPETDSIALNGVPVVYQKTHSFLMHKPPGVLTAARDKKQKTVLDLLPAEYRLPDIAPAGRLDLDTSGLLILTNDGQLAHRMLAPKSHVVKYYFVLLADPYRSEYTARFGQGILLREGAEEVLCQPAACEQIGENTAVLAIAEGKYHQVKRMFAALGNRVAGLMRVQIGALELPADLPPGGCIPLSPKDLEKIWENTAISSVCSRCARDYSSYWIETVK